MSRRARLVASLPHGPRDPVAETPARRPGSARRTTSIDQRRGEPGGPLQLVAAGRDLLTRPDGGTEVLDAVVVRATLDVTGTITAIESDPPEPALAALVGVHASRGFRAAADAAVPAHAEAASVLHQLLDDFPMASLISNYGATREAGDDWELPPEAADRLTDLCSGWARGGTMLGALGDTGIFPIPIGPPAPDLAPADGDPLAWHELEPMAPRSVRRRRRLDLVADPAGGPGAPLVADVHFRDSHLGGDGEPEDVLHEYVLAVAVDPGTLVVRSAEAVARTLPWPECPGALGSAARLVGEPVAGLRPKVRDDFTGTTTCTHLNDTFRSLAGLTALARGLQPDPRQ